MLTDPTIYFKCDYKSPNTRGKWNDCCHRDTRHGGTHQSRGTRIRRRSVIDITSDVTARESAQANINASNVEEYRVGQSTWNVLTLGL